MLKGSKIVYVDYLHKSYFATQHMLTINGKWTATSATNMVRQQLQPNQSYTKPKVSQQKAKIVNNFQRKHHEIYMSFDSKAAQI